MLSKQKIRQKIRKRIRAKISGSASRPRLAVFRSHLYLYAQLIDDVTGRTLAMADSRSLPQDKKKSERGFAVGQSLAEKAKKIGIGQVVFDRAGYRYHGAVRRLAEGARQGGLGF